MDLCPIQAGLLPNVSLIGSDSTDMLTSIKQLPQEKQKPQEDKTSF